MRRLVTHQLFSCNKVKFSYGIWMEGGLSSNRLISSMKNRCFHVFCLPQTGAIEGTCRNKLYTRVDKCPENDTRLRDYKKNNNLMLSSTEHDTFTAHKYKFLKTNGILASKRLDVFISSCS